MSDSDIPRADAVLHRLNTLGISAVGSEHSRLQDSGNLSLELTFEQWEQLFLLAERGVLSPEEGP